MFDHKKLNVNKSISIVKNRWLNWNKFDKKEMVEATLLCNLIAVAQTGRKAKDEFVLH